MAESLTHYSKLGKVSKRDHFRSDYARKVLWGLDQTEFRRKIAAVVGIYVHDFYEMPSKVSWLDAGRLSRSELQIVPMQTTAELQKCTFASIWFWYRDHSLRSFSCVLPFFVVSRPQHAQPVFVICFCWLFSFCRRRKNISQPRYLFSR